MDKEIRALKHRIWKLRTSRQGTNNALARRLVSKEQNLRMRIRAVRSSRNALAPVNQLPLEIFTEIFVWLQTCVVSDPELDPDQIIRWIPATHVCRHWRSLAFSSKTLWTVIPTFHKAYTKLASQLSYPMPVFVTGYDEIEREGIEAFFPLLQRARKVTAGSGSADLLGEALQSTPEKFPCLQEIDFFAFGIGDSHETSPFPKSLKSISLWHSIVQWHWFANLEQLTHLSLDCCHLQVTVDSFVDYMLQLPSLSSLDVHDNFTDDPNATSRRQDSPRLRLRHLVLGRRVLHTIKLLSSVELQGDYTLQVIVAGPPDDSKALFETIDRHLQLSGRIIRMAELDYEDRRFLKLSCFDDHFSSAFLRIEVEDVDKPAAESWSNQMAAFPSDRLQRFATNVLVNEAAWQRASFRFKNLRELVVIDDDSAQAFLMYWAADIEVARHSNNWDSISFPALKMITFANLNIWNAPEVEKIICTTFPERAKRGYEVQELTFAGGDMTYDDGEGTVDVAGRLRTALEGVVEVMVTG
ncbi:hypothetical protein BDN72DRAFT_843776 [Pluteus cervinus]|uniref:Uncharacterized protein n=1 Tax=Pluteus cervinus TaxID=181527 RepID=A0ACD3AMR4_9AGAR|nr:hypothetical protein BDN72DRAFT_843776 [Pluteus cervinus]